MAENKIMALLEALSRATERGQVPWEIAPSENVFRAPIGDGGIRIERRAPSPSLPYITQGERPGAYSLWVVNSQNQVVDAFDFEPGTPGHALLEKLFPLVRKAALKVDQVLDRMLAALESKA
jgi:hypothetical protein